jgi:replication-associated recombination protein RarA
MNYEIITKNGYDFYEVASCLQKAVRRGDARMAGFMALELWASGYAHYLWKRLFTISAEDCWGILTKEIEALWTGYTLVNDKKEPKGRIFISKAVILLCMAKKSRDADHLSNYVYDKKDGLSDDYIREYMADLPEYVEMPGYVYDCHTLRGRKMGKTKEQFFREEYAALENKQQGLFDNLFEN